MVDFKVGLSEEEMKMVF